jgi:alpha-L-fucosidase
LVFVFWNLFLEFISTMDKIKKLYGISLLLLAVTRLGAQVKGDEDKEMFNRLQPRDKQAVENAEQGWWKRSMASHDERIRWWRDARFGMFIHWGIYSLPGGEWKGKKVSGYAEHLMRKEKITRAEYLELAHHFNPEKFNADEWARHARDAGMKYLVITSKHHDGFAMFNSKVGDFTILKQTPFHRDPMAELSAACKKYGIRFGFYYSHAFDWEHPDAPGNDWEYKNPGGDSNLYGGITWYDQHPELLAKAQRYVNEKAIPQIKELIALYHPDILWFDTPHKLPLSENIRILQAIRETDMHVVINGRLAGTAWENFGDYRNTADRPVEFFPVTGDWEAIPTTNESYGYSKYDSSHKPVGFFIRLLARAAARGGNLLMNIGPKGDGSFDERDLRILNGIGKWMQVNGESIYRTEKTVLPLQSWGVSTRRGNVLYLHVLQWPLNGQLEIGGLQTPVRKAWLLADVAKKALPVEGSPGNYHISLPQQAPDTANTVIALQLQGELQADTVRYVQHNVPLTRLLGFDAALHGTGFSYTDGKANHYYVEGWKNRSQYMSWSFKTGQAGTYRVLLKYIGNAQTAGRFTLKLDSFSYTGSIQAETKKGPFLLDAGRVHLTAGLHQLQLQPAAISGEELVKLLEIQLVPVNE